VELKEIETEVREQDEHSADLMMEVESHQQQTERLEVAVHALLEAQLAVDSEGVRRALDFATEAKYTTRQRLEDLREQRVAMVTRNEEIQDRCMLALQKKQEALAKLPLLLWGEQSSLSPGDPGFSLYGSMDQLLREAVDRLAAAVAGLQEVKRRLEEIHF